MSAALNQQQRWKGGPLGFCLILTLCLTVYLPGLASIDVVDRDEARFAQASRQMFESVVWGSGHESYNADLHAGGWLIPMVGDRLRLNKPPLVYWLQSATAAIMTGGNPHNDDIWMYRLPSVLAAIMSAVFTWRLGTRMWDARVGLLAGALMAVCPMVIWDANQARADQLFLACTTGTLLALWAVVDPKSRAFWRPSILLGIGIGLGMLAKGLTPVFVILCVLSWLVLGRRLSFRGIWAGLLASAIALALVLPWGIAVGNQVGWDTYISILTDETVGRSQTAKEGHWGPPGYHLVLLPVLFWPGVLVTGAAVAWSVRRAFKRTSPPGQTTPPGRLARVNAWWRSRRVARAPELFCLCWVFPAWILFELVSTKLPHYTLPLYPAIALLTARALIASEVGAFAPFVGITQIGSTQNPGWSKAGGRHLWVVLGVIIMLAMGTSAIVLNRKEPFGMVHIVPVCGALAGLALVIAAGRQARDGRLIHATRRAILATIVSLAAFLQFAAPSLTRLGTDVRLAIRSVDPDATRPIGAIGYTEDSLTYHTRARVQRFNDEQLPGWIDAHPLGVLVFDAPAYRRALDAGVVQSDLNAITVEGSNLGNGRFETVTIVPARPVAQEPTP